MQEDVEVELRRELERLEVGVSSSAGRECRPHITIQPTSSNNIHRCYLYGERKREVKLSDL